MLTSLLIVFSLNNRSMNRTYKPQLVVLRRDADSIGK